LERRSGKKKKKVRNAIREAPYRATGERRTAPSQSKVLGGGRKKKRGEVKKKREQKEKSKAQIPTDSSKIALI